MSSSSFRPVLGHSHTRASAFDRTIAVVLHLRTLLRVVLGPLQVVSGLTDSHDRMPELLGLIVWIAVILAALCGLGSWTSVVGFLLAEGVVAVLRLVGYRTRDL